MAISKNFQKAMVVEGFTYWVNWNCDDQNEGVIIKRKNKIIARNCHAFGDFICTLEDIYAGHTAAEWMSEKARDLMEWMVENDKF